MESVRPGDSLPKLFKRFGKIWYWVFQLNIVQSVSFSYLPVSTEKTLLIDKQQLLEDTEAMT